MSEKHIYKMHHRTAFSNDLNGFSADERLYYTNKLTFSSGVRFPELDSLSGLWVKDIAEWPELQWLDIIDYLVSMLNLYNLNDFCVLGLLTDLLPSEQRPDQKIFFLKTEKIVLFKNF